MLVSSPSLQADTIEYTSVFAVELIDPVTLQPVPPRGMAISAVFPAGNLWNKPLSRGSRFVWAVLVDPNSQPVAAAVPNSITVTPPANTGYAPFTYAAADIAAGISTDPEEWGLCRLYACTAPTYPFPSGVTQVSGLLRAVPDVAGQPIQVLPGAQLWVGWQDGSSNPATPRAGSRCLSGTRGDFAAGVLFPSKASKSYPATAADGTITLTLYVARFDPVAGWQQAHLVPDPNKPNPLAGIRPGQAVQLPAPIVWSNLTAG
jgi:hypothetical protein